MQQKAKLARVEKAGADQVEIDRARTTLTWYEASLRRLLGGRLDKNPSEILVDRCESNQ
jgi:hypothetical protein